MATNIVIGKIDSLILPLSAPSFAMINENSPIGIMTIPIVDELTSVFPANDAANMFPMNFPIIATITIGIVIQITSGISAIFTSIPMDTKNIIRKKSRRGRTFEIIGSENFVDAIIIPIKNAPTALLRFKKWARTDNPNTSAREEMNRASSILILLTCSKSLGMIFIPTPKVITKNTIL